MRQACRLHHVSPREESDVFRLLIWIGVGLAVIGGAAKFLDRGAGPAPSHGADASRAADQRGAALSPSNPGVSATARRPATAAVPIAPVVARSRPSARGLSFALADEATLPARVASLTCQGDPLPTDRPSQGSCNPHDGDTSCRSELPIACYRSSGAAPPKNVDPAFYKGWTHGQLGATAPVLGAVLKSEPDASARCEAELGEGWRMAEFHDGGGAGLQGERRPGLHAGTRYWVHVNDQRGNCWNSAP
jgi:hypothetical protein